jgi:hypothetical protein
VGRYNSSLTRVRPFFKTLVERDATGLNWFPRLLALVQKRDLFASPDLLSSPGLLRPTNLDTERTLLPPEAFLRWLIQNPKSMTWPRNGRARFGPEAQQWREKLMGRRDLLSEPVARHAEIRQSDCEEATQQALRELLTHGTAGSHKQWWAFEGRTSIDCYLATDRLRIYVEGKRTDILSPSTDWYPRRNQLIRNLESAGADAGTTPFACLVIAEQELSPIPASLVHDSLPHFSEEDRRNLLKNFLGSITWRDACKATGVDYDKLPDTA